MTNTQTTETTAVIRTDNELWQQLLERGYLISPDTARFSAHWLHEGEARLDGGYYTDSVLAARRVVTDGGFYVVPVKRVTTDISYPGRFKRVYAKTEADGVPFLTASAMLQLRPTSNALLAKQSSSLESCRVAQGQMLVTRSGTVGRCVIVGRHLSRFAISDDAIRVRAKDVPIGYLYAFLASWIGQTLLVKDQYGSAIKHLEPHHIEQIPIPLLPEAEQQAIHAEVMRAYALRDEANDLLDAADALLHQELGLPRFDLSLVPYLAPPADLQTQVPPMPHPSAFAVNASALAERLDASYHVPVTRTAVRLMQQGKYPLIPLKRMVKSITIPPRFKRIYVEKDYGIPFLRPSQLPQLRPYDLDYIAESTKVLEQLLLREGNILVTTDGTVGRVSVVTTHTAGWAGSNNIARIKYDTHQWSNGYLAAFLSSPYGFYQLTREIYGGVVDHIEVSKYQFRKGGNGMKVSNGVQSGYVGRH